MNGVRHCTAARLSDVPNLPTCIFRVRVGDHALHHFIKEYRTIPFDRHSECDQAGDPIVDKAGGAGTENLDLGSEN